MNRDRNTSTVSQFPSAAALKKLIFYVSCRLRDIINFKFNFSSFPPLSPILASLRIFLDSLLAFMELNSICNQEKSIAQEKRESKHQKTSLKKEEMDIMGIRNESVNWK